MLYASAFGAGLAANHIGRKAIALRDIHRAAVIEERHSNVVRLLTPYRAEHRIDLVAEQSAEGIHDEDVAGIASPVRLHSVSG